jgi:Peptidase M15
MNVFADAACLCAPRSLICVAALLTVSMAAAPAVKADDNAAWFGQTYQASNMGLSAGVMRLGAGSRAEGTETRRGRRGTQVASLGRDYTVSVEEGEEDSGSRSRSARRARTASLGGDASSPIATTRRGKRSAKRSAPAKLRLASLGGGFTSKPSFGPSLSGGAVRWVASSGCLNSGLRSVIASVASSFGPVTVNSTCRSRGHNARVGGARRSQHLTGNAADFRVRGNWRGVWAFLRSSSMVGGLKHYGGGLFHIDTGARRSW